MEENKEMMKEIIVRKNAFCVISLDVSEIGQHNIQTSSAWGSNPYPDTHIPVADELVEDIRKTRGFCDISLNEEGTEVVSFVAREIPVIPEPIYEPTQDELLWQAITDIEIGQMEQDLALTDLEIAYLEGSDKT